MIIRCQFRKSDFKL